MAITRVSPVAPPQKGTTTHVTPSKTAKGLGRGLGVAGGLAGATTGAMQGAALGAPAGPHGAALGAVAGGVVGLIGGAQGGQALGQTIGEGISPTRTKQVEVTAQPQIPQQLQGFKFSQQGLTVLDAFNNIDQLGPDYAEYKQPLGIALMQDIAANNKRGGMA